MMYNTPPVKNVVDNCVDQYKNVNSVLDTPIFPTPTPALTPTVNPYAPSAEDGNKIQTTIETLRRLRLGASMISDKDNIDKIINQLSTDLMYFKLKNNG